MTAVASLLGTLRSARGRTIEETGADADIGPARLRRLGRGTADLEYLGIRLAKALDLCPNCFRRLFEAATERAVLAAPPHHDPALLPIRDAASLSSVDPQ